MLAIASSATKSDPSADPGHEFGAAPSAQCLRRPGWEACVRADTLVLALHGDWCVRSEGSHSRTPEMLPQHPGVRTVVFDSNNLGSWDSSLLIFLSSAQISARWNASVHGPLPDGPMASRWRLSRARPCCEPFLRCEEEFAHARATY
jgi:hypothetical protein